VAQQEEDTLMNDDRPMPSSSECLRNAAAILADVGSGYTRSAESIRSSVEQANAWTRLADVVLRHEKTR
jgi:hypothetical protein